MWDTLVVDSITSDEQAAGFKWLIQVCNLQTRGHTVLAEGAAEALFASRLATPGAVRFFVQTKQGYDCLRGYFLLVNQRKGNLRRTGTTRNLFQLSVLPQELEV